MVQCAEEDAEQLTQVHVVRCLFEAESAAVVQIHRELSRESLAEHLDGSGHLLLADLLILLFLGRGFEPLPWQRAAIEVHEDISERLHVVSARLFDAQVGVDAGVTRRSGQIFVFPIRNMSSRPVVAILLGQAEIDEKKLVAVTADSHEKVVGLDVSMDEVFVVHELDAADHLIC